jgi:uncharacterized membrane protein YgdD (TMEM256/DUF423 family)
MSARGFGVFGALSGCAAVAAGAFGAHALKQTLTADMLAIFEIAVLYQMFHALALLATAWACTQWAQWPGRSGRALRAAGWCFAAGTALFCGTLYVLALSGQKWLGMLTPVGGALFMAGWLLLAWGIWRGR